MSEDAGNHFETVVLDTNSLQKMNTSWFQRSQSAMEGFSIEQIFDSILSMSEIKMNPISPLTKSAVVMTVFYMCQLLSYDR